jgi:hypothetical protein
MGSMTQHALLLIAELISFVLIICGLALIMLICFAIRAVWEWRRRVKTIR